MCLDSEKALKSQNGPQKWCPVTTSVFQEGLYRYDNRKKNNQLDASLENTLRTPNKKSKDTYRDSPRLAESLWIPLATLIGSMYGEYNYE